MAKSLVLPAEQVEQIEEVLDELLDKTRAAYVFLSDISGQLIQARGRVGSTDVVALSALTASSVAAMAEMARMIGEKQQFHLLFHEGESRNIYLSQVAQSFILAVVFDAGVQIGLIRLFSRRAVEDLTRLAAEYENVVSHTPGMMEAGFDAAFEGELDRLMAGMEPLDKPCSSTGSCAKSA